MKAGTIQTLVQRATSLRAAAAAALVVMWIALPPPARAVDLRGTAEAVAGDTLKIDGKTIGLYGIVAPKPQQRCFDNALPWWCGRYSQEGLARLIKGADVRCTDKGRSPSGTMLALCKVGNADLAESQIRNGLAVADGARGVTYAEAERTARRNQTGIWHGNPDGTFTP